MSLQISYFLIFLMFLFFLQKDELSRNAKIESPLEVVKEDDNKTPPLISQNTLSISHMPTPSNEPQQGLNENGKLMDSSTSKQIYDAVAQQWKRLPIQNRRCKVLAAFVITSDRDVRDVRVLSIGTGSKILFSESTTWNGKVVHDSHAEIIARRALICLLYEHILGM